jgi:hypothetical protein
MKVRLTRWIFALSMFFALGAMYTPANAEVVVRVRHPRRHYRHRPYHRRYRRHSVYRK